MRFFCILSVFIVIVFNCLSCSQSKSNETALKTDHSLSPKEYLDRGLPAIDRPWIAQDYQKSYLVIADLSAQNIALIPHAKSEISKSVISRITNLENLDYYRNRSLPIQERIQPIFELMDSLNSISKIYINAKSKDPKYSVDSAYFACFMLHVQATANDLVIEFLPTLDKSSPKYAERMSGLEQLKKSYAQMLQGITIMLTESDVYDIESRVILSSNLATTYPKITNSLPPLSKIELERSIASIAKNEINSDIKNNLNKLLAGN